MLSKLPTSPLTIFVHQQERNKEYSPVTRSLIVRSLFETVYYHDDGDVITSAIVAPQGRRPKS